MKTTVLTKGQPVLPVEWREQNGIRLGQSFDIERLEAGRYLLKLQPSRLNEGVVDWLLNCPAKGWFEPLPSESTDTL